MDLFVRWQILKQKPDRFDGLGVTRVEWVGSRYVEENTNLRRWPTGLCRATSHSNENQENLVVFNDHLPSMEAHDRAEAGPVSIRPTTVSSIVTFLVLSTSHWQPHPYPMASVYVSRSSITIQWSSSMLLTVLISVGINSVWLRCSLDIEQESQDQSERIKSIGDDFSLYLSSVDHAPKNEKLTKTARTSNARHSTQCSSMAKRWLVSPTFCPGQIVGIYSLDFSNRCCERRLSLNAYSLVKSYHFESFWSSNWLGVSELQTKVHVFL